jgi:hypothetical protein
MALNGSTLDSSRARSALSSLGKEWTHNLRFNALNFFVANQCRAFHRDLANTHFWTLSAHNLMFRMSIGTKNSRAVNTLLLTFRAVHLVVFDLNYLIQSDARTATDIVTFTIIVLAMSVRTLSQSTSPLTGLLDNQRINQTAATHFQTIDHVMSK